MRLQAGGGEREGGTAQHLDRGSSVRAPEEFLQLLGAHGIRYDHLGESLGGFRPAGYEAHLLTAAFRRGLEELEDLARSRPTVIMCAERFPWRRHRRFVARALEGRGWRGIHILDENRTWSASLGREARQA